MSDFETRLRATVQAIADDSPEGDELPSMVEERVGETLRRTRKPRLIGGTLAIAAILVAAIATAAVVRRAPAHRTVVGARSPQCNVRAIVSPAIAPIPGESFPPEDAAPPAGKRPMTERQAIATGAAYGGTNAAGIPYHHATATEISYQAGERVLGDESPDQRIAPTRCVWLVRVDAPFFGLGGPLVVPPKTLHPPVTVAPPNHFFVLFDVNSGFMFEMAR